MKKTVSTELSSENIKKITEILANMPGEFEQLCQRLTNEQLRQPLGSGERSVTEILAHILHTEARSSEAITLALLADEPLLVDIHPERDFGKLARYDLLPFTDLLAYFKVRRAILMRVLAVLSEAQWARSVREPGKQRKESVYWRARSMAMHELEHIADIESKVDKLH
jgi:hypothetical protein